MVEFWLDRLEAGCSEAVFGSAVAAIAKMPVIAQVPYVLDMERLLPAYVGGEPMKLLRRTSFADYLDAIRPRLKALEQRESKPKVIPRIFQFWKDPEAFRGILAGFPEAFRRPSGNLENQFRNRLSPDPEIVDF